MEIRGEHRFAAPRQVVWDTLHDPTALRAAIPGCERLEPRGPDEFDATVRIGVAALKGTYRGTVRVEDVQEPDRYRLVVDASGALGSADGGCDLRLEEVGGATVVRYDGEIGARGGVARLGSHLLTGTAGLLIGQFFKSMERQVAMRTP